MKLFSELQKIGKALLTPVAVLPAAGLLLALGNKLHIPLMEQTGGVIFANLPLLFCVGVAVGLANDGIAGLAAIVAFLVMNTTIGIVAGITSDMIGKNPAYASVMGIPTLQTGVFGGLVAGVIAAVMFKKFYNIELPAYLGFFAGKRFVPIVTALVAFIIGLAMPYLWKPVQSGVAALSYYANESNTNVSTFLFGLVERALVPFGLHHIFYPPFWWQFGEYTTKSGQIVTGDQTIWFAMLKDGVKSFNSPTYQGAGKFMAGKFPFMMFGLPAAGLAMYHEAKPEKKKLVGGILFSAALTSFITGITEPIEFAFLFVAPVLFAIHAVFAGFSFMIMNMLQVRVESTFSGGIIDFIGFGVLPATDGFQTRWILAVLVGLGFAAVYYFLFRFTIRKFVLKTPGREVEDIVEMIKEENMVGGLAHSVLEALGGRANIVSVDSCITRLRVEVRDAAAVDDSTLKKLGAMGVLKVGKNGIQAVFGSKAQFICNDINGILYKE